MQVELWAGCHTLYFECLQLKGRACSNTTDNTEKGLKIDKEKLDGCKDKKKILSTVLPANCYKTKLNDAGRSVLSN